MPLAENEALQRALVLVVLAASVVVLWRLGGEHDGVGERLRSRLVMGVPWGTLVVVAGVLAVYLFLQGGWDHWVRPVTIAYSAWSYFYPLGTVAAAFSHSGPTHLLGNLTATLVVMPIAEYAVGHFPRERGSGTFTSPWTNPWLRALVLFPAAVAVVGVLTALWAWGPIIGFSGVVFAAAGFALVRYPLAAVLALLAQDVVLTGYRSLLNPVVIQEATQRFVTPSWVGIAVQGHALGLFLGMALAVGLLWRRGRLRTDRPGPLRLWLGTVLAAMSLGLWAVWWVRGGDEFVLFRALGLGFVLFVGVAVTAAVWASDRSLLGSLSRREAATALLVVPLLVMALVAVPVNLNTVEDGGAPPGTDPVQVRDYTVVYAEDVPDRMINVVDVSLFGESTAVNTSGVIVASERRSVWRREVPPGQLSTNGRASVVVGGPGWRSVVVAEREGWSLAGGGATYVVRMARLGDEPRQVFASDPSRADPILAGFNVSVAPADGDFRIVLSRNGTVVDASPVPAAGESVTLQGVAFTRDGRSLVASVDGTRVTVARKESYED